MSEIDAEYKGKNIASQLSDLGKGMYTVLIEKPGQVIASVLHGVEDIFDVIGSALKSLGTSMRKFIAFLSALFNWEDITTLTEVMSSHYKKMLMFLRSDILGRKRDILVELGKYVSKLGNSFQDAGHVLKSNGLNLFGDMKSFLSNPLKFQRNGTSGIDGGGIQPMGMGSSRFINLVSNAMNVSDSKLILDADSNGKTGMEVTQFRQERISVIFSEFIGKIKVVFSNQTSSPQFHEFCKRQLKTIEDQFQGPRGFFGADWSIVLNSLGTLASKSIGFTLLKSSEAILDLFEVVIRLFGHLMNSRVAIPLITPLFEKHVMKRRESMNIMTLVCFIGSIFVASSYQVARPGDKLLTQTEADLIISVRNPTHYFDRWVSASRKVKYCCIVTRMLTLIL